MRIEHIAFWVNDLELMRAFYQKYFGLKCNKKYTNTRKGFSSYFLSYTDGTRIEIMNMNQGAENTGHKGLVNGFAHLAFSTGSKDKVDQLTAELKFDGFEILGQPRITGDGYYESVVLDPEGNWIEITV